LLSRESEQPFDELLLADNIAFRQPADLAFADDVHCFVSRDAGGGVVGYFKLPKGEKAEAAKAQSAKTG
jgi:hypothetical protein